MLVATLAIASSCSSSNSFPHDGFINFEPSVDMFPGPPVADAEVTFGFNEPRTWQWEPTYCPSPTLTYPTADSEAKYPVTGLDFVGVRYDWTEDETAKAWVITEQTIEFADGDARGRYLDEFGDAIAKCGWEYDAKWGYGYNAVPIELSRLPNGSVAYRSELDPRADYIASEESAIEVITVLVPGDQRNHLIVVVWIGWGTELAAESAETVAATLAAKANAAGSALKEEGG